ncbi:epoxide hydrolase A-like [Pyrus x bretschneideri]|uniref:epoxide hydrolase A-like n=1 Tax=Pyrus x bretschneideri TaxID=225117 RepID=UPI00202DF168|nr:epoxide hydrolase A-like [Pyrus x bretschneideri]
MSSGKSEQESGRWVVRVPRSRMRCRGEQSRRRSRSRSRESKDGEVEVEVRSDFKDEEVMSDFRDGEVMSDFKKKIEDERRKGRGRSRESKDSIRAKPKTNGHDWKIQHRHVQARGPKLHLAEIRTGPKVVLFLHGFPEIWYTWRHQMVAVADKGHRAIAIDFRGLGLSEQPAESEKAIFKDLVDDVVGLLDSLSINKDFGALPAYLIPALHPECISGMITVGVPFLNPANSPVRFDLLPKGFYMLRWKKPGRAEADISRFDVKTVIRNIYILFSGSELQVAAPDQEIMDLVDPATPLPPWFSEDDLAVYASLYEKSGFRYAIQITYQ